MPRDGTAVGCDRMDDKSTINWWRIKRGRKMILPKDVHLVGAFRSLAPLKAAILRDRKRVISPIRITLSQPTSVNRNLSGNYDRALKGNDKFIPQSQRFCIEESASNDRPLKTHPLKGKMTNLCQGRQVLRQKHMERALQS